MTRFPGTLFEGTPLCLLRHSEVDAGWRGRIYGCLDAPLSDQGREQSQLAAEALRGIRWEAVVSSGLSRTEDTARHLRDGSPRTLERIDDARLREIDRGRWAGWDEARVEADQPGGWRAFWDGGGRFIPPEGEDLTQLQERVVSGLDDLTRRFRRGPLAVVAHRWVLRVAAAHALHWPVERCGRIDVPYAGMLVFDWVPSTSPDAPSTARLVLASQRALRGWEPPGPVHSGELGHVAPEGPT